MPTVYSTGQLSVAAGSATVNIAGAALLANVKEGDTLWTTAGARVGIVAAVVSETQLTLYDVAPAAHTNAPYRALRTGEGWSQVKTLNTLLSERVGAFEATYQALATGAVRADAAQGFSPPQKAQARQNVRPHHAANLTFGTLQNARLPPRLQSFPRLITDWNATPLETGFLMANNGVNAPVAGQWFMGLRVAHNTTYARDVVWALVATTPANRQTYVRDIVDGTIGPWERSYVGAAEQIAAFQPFTPVEQGGGANQLTNKLRLGWGTDGHLRAQVDATDLGRIATAFGTPRTVASTGFIRHPFDNWQVAWGSVAGTTNAGGDLTATFANAFAAQPFPIVCNGDSVALATRVDVAFMSTTTVTARFINQPNATGRFNYVAIGPGA